ncbi:replicative DNA helicase [Mycoplasma struthionis]|uniref:DNA 5'-3' helicase n=1 Tax=Mycoplasma struthionis TaxID=538220 RepID=A0A502M7N8_9MOLU|nr:replicative DNA helicase [Mycoplasma struthionis]TPI02264.1 replicative DNA helicase [Mycoplasma struthionis]
MAQKDISVQIKASLNNEISLLGLIIADNSAYLKVAEIVKPEMFYFTANQVLFRELKQYNLDNLGSDIVGFLNFLVNKKKIEEIDMSKYLDINEPYGTNYINFLIQNRGFEKEVSSYVKNLVDSYKTRLLYALSQKTQNVINNEEFNIDDLITKVQVDLMNLDLSEINVNFQHVSDVASELVSDILNRSDNDVGVGLQTGFPELDNYLVGLNPGYFVILAARPAMGKTAFALNLAVNMAKSKNKKTQKNLNVLLFSLEMSKAQLMQRLLAIESTISIRSLKTGDLSKDQLGLLSFTVQAMQKWNMFLCEKSSLTISDIITISKRFAGKTKPDIIIIDYLQLINGGSAESRHLEVGRISRSLKILAGELGCPIIALSQLNRNVEKREDKTPILADINESGSIEQDADIVLFLYRKDYYTSRKKKDKENENTEIRPIEGDSMDNFSITDVIVAKNRHGSTGVAQLTFMPTYNMFVSNTKADIHLKNQKKGE